MAIVKLGEIAHQFSRHDAEFHKGIVADLLGRPNFNFPGAQPVSFARRHLRELETVDYYVAEKTDGARCLLFLTQIFEADGPREAQFLIDRRNDYYLIEKGFLHIPPPNAEHLTNQRAPPYLIQSWHLGTILDGELVRQRRPGGKEQLTYLIFDLLTLDNRNITDRTYDTRIGKLENFVLKPWKAFARDWPDEIAVQPFGLSLKQPQLGYGVEMMLKKIIPELPHGNDGLIFTCKDTPYVTGTDQHILKWKPPHENTVDFRLVLRSFPIEEDEDGTFEDFDQKPEIELQAYYGSNDYRKFDILYLTDEEWESMKRMNQAFDCRIIECWRESSTSHWRPKLDGKLPRFRDDKEHANHHTVVNSVLESIEDAVTEEELLAHKDRLRDAWKAREKARLQEKEQQKKQQQETSRMQQHQAAPKPTLDRGPSVDRTRGETKGEMTDEEKDGPGYED